MSAFGFSTPDRRDWLRLFGGILFAAGAVALAFRKGNDWSNWAIFFVFLVATLVLYGAALAGSRGAPALQSWESGLYTFAILLLPITLLALVSAVDDTPDGRLNTFWVFAVSAGVATYIGLRRGAWWQMLIAGIWAIVSWIALWSKILDNPSADTIRWLLIALAALLLLGALVLARQGRPQAADLITAAGIAAVLAGAIGIAGLASGAPGLSGLVTDSAPKPTQAWNVYLLIVSLALIAYGARSVTRGPGYIGALGFGTFIVLVGTNAVAQLKGEDTSAVVGWPLFLLIAGALLLISGFLAPTPGPGARTTQSPPAAGPPPPPPPPGYGQPPQQ